MTLKIKTPTKRQTPDSLLGFGSVGKADARELLAIEVSARDAQWLELVGPVVEALQLIAETDSVDAALDPQRAVRVARTALRAITEEQE